MIVRKCLQCGEYSENSEKCLQCNTPFVTEKTVKEKVYKEHKKRLETPKEELGIVVFINKMKNHRLILVSIIGYVFYSVFMVLFFIVSAISYIIALIAA